VTVGIRSEIIHASSVAVHNAGVVILGDSGCGKSGLALDLMSRGASLIADDRTVLSRQDDQLVASVPAAIRGRIEARGVGILGANYAGPTIVALAVDLDKNNSERLPPLRCLTLLGIEIDLIFGGATPNLAAVITQYLKGTRVA